jgi:hypothetical protein
MGIYILIFLIFTKRAKLLFDHKVVNQYLIAFLIAFIVMFNLV